MKIAISGYWDPLHVGHLDLFEKACELGDELIVIVNSDKQAIMKKGKSFMPVEERVVILSELRCVDYVRIAVDKDRTVCKTLATVEPKPDFFCNGGDQNNEIIPEINVCKERNIILKDGFGDKIQSSSWLIAKSKT